MILNNKKTQAAGDISNIKFLGYQIRNGVPLKPKVEFWAALRFPEHPDRSFDEYATRAIGITLATFGQHDDFYEAARRQLTAKSFQVSVKPVYIDDILVWGKSKKEHYARLEKILQLEKKKNIRFTLKKCSIRYDRTKISRTQIWS